MTLGSTQPLTEMSTRDRPRGKGAHTRTSLARESDSARVPVSQTRLFVGRKVGSPLMRVLWNISEPGSRVNLAEPDSYVYGHLKGRPVRKADNLTAICEPII
jgi:hypothetical protein